MSTHVIAALDNLSATEVDQVVDELHSVGIHWFKVGLELFTKKGPSLVSSLKKRNLKVFLDLKIFDIPNTVFQVTKSIAELGVDLTTVHCLGGGRMLEAAVNGCSGSQLNILGVTVLTSFDKVDLQDVFRMVGNHQENANRKSCVNPMVQLCIESGVHGIVCSVSDLSDAIKTNQWKKELSSSLIVTPGIRPLGASKNDQREVATPSEAAKRGATHLVIGRPLVSPEKITRQSAARLILKEIGDI